MLGATASEVLCATERAYRGYFDGQSREQTQCPPFEKQPSESATFAS